MEGSPQGDPFRLAQTFAQARPVLLEAQGKAEGRSGLRANDIEWFRPLWLRVLVTGGCIVWSLFEWFVAHDQLWGLLTAGAAAYSVYNLFITFPKDGGKSGGSEPPSA